MRLFSNLVSHKSLPRLSVTRLINLLGLMRDPMQTGDTGMIGSHCKSNEILNHPFQNKRQSVYY